MLRRFSIQAQIGKLAHIEKSFAALLLFTSTQFVSALSSSQLFSSLFQPEYKRTRERKRERESELKKSNKSYLVLEICSFNLRTLRDSRRAVQLAHSGNHIHGYPPNRGSRFFSHSYSLWRSGFAFGQIHSMSTQWPIIPLSACTVGPLPGLSTERSQPKSQKVSTKESLPSRTLFDWCAFIDISACSTNSLNSL